MPNKAYTIAMSRWLSRPPEHGYEIMENVEQFPEFMPNVNVVKLLEHEGNRKVASWDIMLDDAPLSWVEEGLYDRDEFLIRFRSLEGVFDRFDGFWKVQAESEGSRISFELVYEIGLPEIEEIVGPLLHQRLVENAESMLDAIEKRVWKAS